MAPALQILALIAAAVLLAFSLRRAILLLVALLPDHQPHLHTYAPTHIHTVLILIPCRNEARALPHLLEAVDRLDCERDQTRVIVVDDGSTDLTAAIAQDWSASRPWVRVVRLPRSVGKAQALNEALLAADHTGDAGDIVVIYDADHRPAPGALRALVAPFADVRTAAVSGQMRVANGEAGPAAFYAMIESHVHQFVTMRAKDRLALAPAVLGSNCAYRRSALRAAGGFRPGALLEDSDLTLALTLAGGRTRFAADALSEHNAPVSLRGYARQHLRWNRGFHQAAGARLGSVWRSAQLPLRLKIELTFFALGYADRLALLAGALFTAVDLARPGTFGFPWLVWPIYFGAPALEMLAALALAREGPAMYLRLAYVPFFFMVDLAVALASTMQTLARRPMAWTATERQAD